MSTHPKQTSDKSESITRQIIKARRDVKRKLNRIRDMRFRNMEFLRGNLQSVITPLIKQETGVKVEKEEEEELGDKVGKKEELIKKPTTSRWPGRTSKQMEFWSFDNGSVRPSTAVDESEGVEEFNYDDDDDGDDDVFEADPRTVMENVPKQRESVIVPSNIDEMRMALNTEEGSSYLNNLAELPRRYLKFLTSSSTNVDNASGVRFDPDSQSWKLGIRPVNFEGNNLLIGDKLYDGTPGLYSLLFEKSPTHYDTEDLKVYKDILKYTRAHYDNYGSGRKITTTGTKYNEIIKIVFPPRSKYKAKSTGAGSKKITSGLLKRVPEGSSKIEYVPFTSMNELVDRLRLLYASEKSGNTSIHNEIVSIIKTLRANHIIE